MSRQPLSWLWRGLPVILFTALFVVLALALTHRHAENDRFDRHIGETVPRTALIAVPPSLTPAKSFLTDQWHGQPYIVNFFASWCLPCQAEHDSLMRLARSGIPVIGIAFKDRPDALRQFIAKNGNPYAVIAGDTNGQTAIDWSVTGVPETFVVDKNGAIRFHETGPLTDTIMNEQILPLWRSFK